MNDKAAIIIAVIASVPPTITAGAALVVSLKTQEKVEIVHKATNSLTAQLVQTTRSDALQEGKTEGIKEQKAAEKKK